MDVKFKLLVAAAALSLASVALSGCGNDCATGTTESDGQCIPDKTTCGAGTTLVNGKCQLDASGCGEGASLNDQGKCVADAPTGQECGAGTKFDSATTKCIPEEVIECGANTTKVDGKCVPASTVCAANTVLNNDGQCVVDAPACGTGTQLDPNTGRCAVTTQVCGANTAFDSASNTCKPTGTVCDAGTVFSDATGLCLPEATCRMGDVIVEGKCSSASQALAQMATVTATENDDPRLGGTANAVTIPAAGSQLVFKGEIGAPVDLDNDGKLDQDYDFFSFTATAGQHISVNLQVIGGPSLSFALLGPDDVESPEFVRFSGFGARRGGARTFVIPKDGTYYLAVAPTVSLIQGDDAGPFGEAGWEYVGTMEYGPALTATDVDVTMGNIMGSFADLSDNLHKVTGVPGGTLVDVKIEKVGVNAQGVLQVWTSPTQFLTQFGISQGDTLRLPMPDGDTLMFFDWVAANGADLDYEVSVTPLVNQENLGALPAGSGTATSTPVTLDTTERYIAFTVAAGQVVEISHANDGTATSNFINLAVRDAQGTTVFSDTSFNTATASTPERGYFYSPNGGSYVITARATGTTTTRDNSAITVKSMTPNPLGSFMVGQQISGAQPNAVDRAVQEFHTFTLTEDAKLVGTLSSGAQLRLYDTTTGQAGSPISSAAFSLNAVAGTYLISLGSTAAALPNGYTITADVQTPPVMEMEPNNDRMTANTLALQAAIAGTTYSIETSAQGDPDFYKLTVVTPGFYQISLTSSSFCLDVVLNDDAGTELWTAEVQNPSTTLPLAAGDHYIKVSGWCTSTMTSIDYEIIAQPAPVTSLGTLMAGGGTQSTAPTTLAATPQIYTFTVAAGEVVEISHLNDGTSTTNTINLRVLDSMNAVVFNDTVFNSTASSTPEYGTFYSPNGGTYTIVASSSTARNNSVITVKSITPTALGAVMSGGGIQSTTASTLALVPQHYAFTVAAGEAVEITHTNDGTATANAINLIVRDAQGATVFSDTSFNTTTASTPERGYFYSLNGGSYVITTSATSATTTRTNSVVTVKSMTPNPLGSFSVGQQINGAQPNAVAPRAREYHKLTVGVTGKLVGSLSAGSLFVFDSAGTQLASYTTPTAIANLDIGVTAGDYLVAIEAPTAGLPMGYTLSLTVTAVPPLPAPHTASPMLAIPDNNMAGVTTTLSVSRGVPCLIAAMVVDMNITHTYRGDVVLELTSPMGTTVRLQNSGFDSAENIIGVYGLNLTPAAPLSGFNGQDANGTWTLFARDAAVGDTGTLNSWGLSFICQ